MRLLSTYLLIGLLGIVSIFLFSCGKESSCFKGSGNDITELRNITKDVTTIYLEDNIDLVLKEANEASLKLEGGENLLPFINTDVTGTELKISSDNNCGFLRNYKRKITAYLSLPDVKLIEYTGQGNITNTGILNYKEFTIESRNGTGSINLTVNSNKVDIAQHTGPADFTINGTTIDAFYYTGGNGWMYFNDLKAENVYLNHSGSGDMFVQAINSLFVQLLSSGNLNYYGNPNLTIIENSGSGQLIKK